MAQMSSYFNLILFFTVINLCTVYQGQQSEVFNLVIYSLLLSILMNVLLKLF